VVFDDDDDGPVFRRPPSADDRLWRHPSEIGSLLPDPDPPARRLGTVWFAALSSAVGASLVTAGLVLALLDPVAEPAAIAPVSATTAPGTPATLPGAGSEPVVALTRRLQPSLVRVVARQPGPDRVASGIIFHPHGYVLTSARALGGARGYEAELADGRVVGAELVGTDPATDAAVLRLDASGFTTAPLGSTADLEVGQVALVIGSSARRGETSVSVGVVNAVGQDVATTDGRVLAGMIRTDSGVPGWGMGSALVDQDGEIIGLATVADTAQGPVTVAVPIEVATAVAGQLMEWGEVSYSWLGVQTSDLEPARARDLGVEGGTEVDAVDPGGPAATGGVAGGDVIVALEGTEVTTAAGLVAAVQQHRPGDAVELDVVRDGEALRVDVVLGQRRPPG